MPFPRRSLRLIAVLGLLLGASAGEADAQCAKCSDGSTACSWGPWAQGGWTNCSTVFSYGEWVCARSGSPCGRPFTFFDIDGLVRPAPGSGLIHPDRLLASGVASVGVNCRGAVETVAFREERVGQVVRSLSVIRV